MGKQWGTPNTSRNSTNVFSPRWRETRSATVRCYGPWDRSPSSGAPPDLQHPSQAAAAAGGSDVSALIDTLLASHLPLHLKRTFPCFISQAIFSQAHCTQYRPDQRKRKNNNPKTVRPVYHSTDVKELYQSRGWPRPVHGSKAAITEPSRAKSYGQLPPPQDLGIWTISSCLCIILSSSFRCTQRQCACSTGKNTPIPPKPHYNMQSLPLEVSRTIFPSHLEWSQSWPGFKQEIGVESNLNYHMTLGLTADSFYH